MRCKYRSRIAPRPCKNPLLGIEGTIRLIARSAKYYHSQKKKKRSQIEIYQNNVEVGSHDPLEEEIRSFLTAVINRTRPLVSGEDARKSLTLAIDIIRKMKTAEVI